MDASTLQIVGTPGLFRIPLETRQQIYSYVLPSQDDNRVVRPDHTRLRKQSHGHPTWTLRGEVDLFRTCQQINAECSHVLYGTHVFYFDDVKNYAGKPLQLDATRYCPRCNDPNSQEPCPARCQKDMPGRHMLQIIHCDFLEMADWLRRIGPQNRSGLRTIHLHFTSLQFTNILGPNPTKGTRKELHPFAGDFLVKALKLLSNDQNLTKLKITLAPDTDKNRRPMLHAFCELFTPSAPIREALAGFQELSEFECTKVADLVKDPENLNEVATNASKIAQRGQQELSSRMSSSSSTQGPAVNVQSVRRCRRRFYDQATPRIYTIKLRSPPSNLRGDAQPFVPPFPRNTPRSLASRSEMVQTASGMETRSIIYNIPDASTECLFGQTAGHSSAPGPFPTTYGMPATSQNTLNAQTYPQPPPVNTANQGNHQNQDYLIRSQMLAQRRQGLHGAALNPTIPSSPHQQNPRISQDAHTQTPRAQSQTNNSQSLSTRLQRHAENMRKYRNLNHTNTAVRAQSQTTNSNRSSQSLSTRLQRHAENMLRYRNRNTQPPPAPPSTPTLHTAAPSYISPPPAVAAAMNAPVGSWQADSVYFATDAARVPGYW